MTLSEELRAAATQLRRKPTPLAELIPVLQRLADRAEKQEEALDALLLAYAHSEVAGDGGSVDWDNVDEAFDQASKCRPGKYEALVRELGGET
jgi:hypothetical protein